MKLHLSFSVLALGAAALLASCTPNEREDSGRQSITISVDRFTEDGSNPLQTKTNVDPARNYAITWAEGDTIGIFPREGFQEPFKIPSNQVGQTTVKFDGGYWDIKDGYAYNAYYPFDIANFRNSDMMTRIPVSYLGQYQNGTECNAGAYDYTYSDWMTADMGRVNFAFHHLGSFLVFSLPVEAGATYNRLTLVTGEALIPVSGTYDLTAAAPSFIPDAGSYTNELEMRLDNFTGVQGEMAVFYMMMPPTDLSGTTMKVVLSAASGSCTYSVASKNIKASKLYRLEGTLIENTVSGVVDPWEDDEFTYVDLGLPSGAKWANRNIGADRTAECGDYFAWGDPVPYYTSTDPFVWKADKPGGYIVDNYKFAMPDGNFIATYTKYVNQTWMGYGYGHTYDNKFILEPEDDAAHVICGEGWRTPTFAEWKELGSYCTVEAMVLNGVSGCKVTSNVAGYQDKWIFIPATGDPMSPYEATGNGMYWSSSLAGRPYDASFALLLSYGSFGQINYYNTRNRFEAACIRPVYSTDPTSGITGISLDKSTITVSPFESGRQIVATVSARSGAVNKDVIWTTSDRRVADIDENGNIVPLSDGTATITATTAFGGYSASCTVIVEPLSEDQDYNFHSYVDLGLSVKWATTNVGSYDPKDAGDYFAWAATQPFHEPGMGWEIPQNHWRSGFSDGYNFINVPYQTVQDIDSGTIEDGYPESAHSNARWMKYLGDASSPYADPSASPADAAKSVLDPEDDAAHVNWGGSWRMPTAAECQELLTNCTWTRTKMSEVEGYKITSNVEGYTDRWIFLPVTGFFRLDELMFNDFFFGLYWTSSLESDSPSNAYFMGYDAAGNKMMSSDARAYGYAIRPVSK